MRTLHAATKMMAFVAATLGFYLAFLIGKFIVPNKIYWRQVTFKGWTNSFIRIANMKVEISGISPKPPFFLVTNHLGYVDLPALQAAVTGVFVAKAEIEGWFLAGRIVRDMGTIFIDRTNRRDIPRAGELIVEKLDAGEGVIVFPEGTSTKGEEVLPFNSSFLEFAAQRDLPVSYAAISYRTPPGEMPASLAACWWEDISFFAHLWRLFHVKELTAVVKFGDAPVINRDRKSLASELNRKVSELFEPVI